MDREQLAREWDVLYDRMRDQLQALKLDQSAPARDAGDVIGELLGKFDRILGGYVGSMDSGSTRVTVND